ncbi:MAG: hypothetical protein ACFWTQ_07630 [Lactococcus sp.]|jgi:hypothetical protein
MIFTKYPIITVLISLLISVHYLLRQLNKKEQKNIVLTIIFSITTTFFFGGLVWVIFNG